MTVNVGVIGVGMIGQDHIRRLTTVLAGAKVVAVSDVDAARARSRFATDGRESLRYGRGPDRRRRGRGHHRFLLGPDARRLRSGGDQGRQAGVLREAAGDHGSGLS